MESLEDQCLWYDPLLQLVGMQLLGHLAQHTPVALLLARAVALHLEGVGPCGAHEVARAGTPADIYVLFKLVVRTVN